MGISSPGVGSGLDVSTIVSKLMAIEQQPLKLLQTQETKLQTKISAFGKVQAALSTLQDAASALNNAATWQAATATSSDDKSVSVAAGAAAAPGGYAIQVSRLAQRQAVASGPLSAATAEMGAGTLHVQMGSIDGAGAFAADAARPQVDITVAAGDTLSKVRDKINAAGAGVSASIVNDGAGVRMVLRSTETGAQQAFRIGATDAGGGANATALSALAFDPSGAGSGAMTRTLSASDAAYTIDNLALTSPTNRVTGAIEGVTVDLKKAGDDPVDVQVATNKDALKESIKKFTDAYNAVNSLLADQTKYDPATKVAGTLQGNSTAVNIQSQLRAILRQEKVPGGATPAGQAAPLTRLSDVGITLQRDGSLSTDSAKLDAALADPARVKQLFATADTDATRTGFAQRFYKLTFATLGTDGAISGANDAMQRMKRDLDDRQDAMQRRLDATQARLLRQYNNLDVALGKITSIDFSKLTGNSSS